ncbi:ejaculatory bulb-specific protein 3-like [Cimex lectularius]|uniref:Chemosensory protein n=1 Tax=Cimex lectularius TaxID=79782 RepID=A0A8I6RZI2_CIMLE|nr:ejaculatory bulb-specific protein 3-like [Cimex lectularius]
MDFKCSVFFCFVLSFVVANGAETYTDKFDNIDVDEILQNQRLYKSYFDCLKNEGKCTPDGKELKEALPDALANGCAKCSEKQRKSSEKVIKHLIENKPEDFKVLEKLYDPEGEYRKKYEKEAKELGIKV